MIEPVSKLGNDILALIKGATVPNVELFLVSMQELATKGSQECQQVQTNAKTCFETIQRKKEKISDHELDYVPEHDPGRRGMSLFESQKMYLANIGPYQPRLAAYPLNHEIKTGKQRKFPNSWYDEYPDLEYSLHKDAVYCFVCSLLP